MKVSPSCLDYLLTKYPALEYIRKMQTIFSFTIISGGLVGLVMEEEPTPMAGLEVKHSNQHTPVLHLQEIEHYITMNVTGNAYNS